MSDVEYREESSLELGRTPESAAAAANLADLFLEGETFEEQEPVAAAVPMTAPSIPAPQEPETEVQEEAPVEVQPFDFTSFEPNLTPDLAELLEDEPPDFEAEARAEIAAQQQHAEDQGEWLDLGDQDQAAQIRANEKRIAFLESRLVETNRGKWVRENLNAYPLLEDIPLWKEKIQGIQATSRRAFAREAASMYAEIAPIAKVMHERIAAQLAGTPTAKMTAAAEAQARANVTAAWGTPASDIAATGASAAKLQKIQDARKTEDLSQVIRAHLEDDTSAVL